MNIVLINHYAGSLHHGMEFRPFYLSREWVRRGHEVTVIAASHSHVRSAQPTCLGTEAREAIEGVHYRWLATPAYSGNGLGRVRNMATFVARLSARAAKIARECRPDAVIASSTYPLDIFPAHAIARRAKARLIFEVHDLWPLSPQVLGGMSKWHPFIATMQVAENLAYRWADAVVSLLPAAKPHMVRHGMAPEKFFHIPNGIAPEDWDAPTAALPAEHQALIENLRRKGRFVVGYLGAHGVANGLDTLLRAATCLPASVCVILVGDGPLKTQLRNEAERQRIQNIYFLPPVPKETVPALLKQFDALVLLWRRCLLYEFGISPNKLFDYMMAGKPIVHAVEAANDPVREAGCGLTVPAESPEALARAVVRLSELSPEERAAMGARGCSYVLERHRYEKLAVDFEYVLQGNLVS